MKIVIAPDSFKESLSAQRVAAAIESGFKKIYPDADYVKVPMADGGEGSVNVIHGVNGGELVTVRVRDALMREVDASYLISADGRDAYIEMAMASGIELIAPDERDPHIASTFGTGQLIRDALHRRVRKIIVFIGGSATNDGGAGMAQALGVRLLDKEGNELPPGCSPLASLASIDMTAIMAEVGRTEFEVACDVENPLLGKRGATAVFGPQKGATEKDVPQLEAALSHYAHLIKKELTQDITEIKGGGAAGGLGAGLSVFCNAVLRKGFDIVSEAVSLPEKLKNADLLITGEGRIDAQSVMGKVPTAVAKLAKLQNIPVIAIAGALAEDVEAVYEHGLDAVFSIVNGPCDLPGALKESEKNIITTSRNIASVIKISK